MADSEQEIKKLEDELAQQRPFYIIGLHVFLTIFFIIYDALVFLPFKLFADPEKKLELSERVKVATLFSKALIYKCIIMLCL
jgi:hypothetical protein